MEQKDAKYAKRRDLCDLRDLLSRILEQRGIAKKRGEEEGAGLVVGSLVWKMNLRAASRTLRAPAMWQEPRVYQAA